MGVGPGGQRGRRKSRGGRTGEEHGYLARLGATSVEVRSGLLPADFFTALSR